MSQHQTLAAEAECLQAVGKQLRFVAQAEHQGATSKGVNLRRLADDILNETIPDLDLVHVIGHYDFLKCIVAALTPAKQHMATRALERYDAGKSTWDQFTREMQKLGIGSRGLDDLALLDICGEFEATGSADSRPAAPSSAYDDLFAAPLAEVKLNLADLSPTILGFAHSALADVEKVSQVHRRATCGSVSRTEH